MLWLSRKDIEHISRRLLRDYLKKVPQKVDHIDPADFAEKMCGLQFTFADISEAHDAIGLTATSGVIITIPQRDGTKLDYELDGKTAFIDQSLVAENQIGRLNFTMMHEAAHQLFWMLYPEEYEVQTPRCVFRIRELKELGVNVRFEREGIDTVNVSSELITAIYAAFAQKESESISGNMQWSYQRRMESGEFNTCKAPWGFRLDGRKLKICEPEADIVQRIFREYLSGKNPQEIADDLNASCLTERVWNYKAVDYILQNERYAGNALLQKRYTPDMLSRQQKTNHGEREMYFVPGSNDAIISPEIFKRAQGLRQKRSLGKAPVHSEIISQIRCICGARMRFKNVNSKWYLCCTSHDTKGDCLITPIRETQIHASFCRLYYKLKHQSIPILEQMLTSLQLIRNRRMLWSPDIVALNKRISDISSQNQTLAFLKQQGLVDPDIFIAKTNELTKQLQQAKLEKEKLMDAESDMTALQTRDLIDILEDGPEFLDSFDAELFAELVEKIIIESNDSVRFCLKNGLELRESIERTVR